MTRVRRRTRPRAVYVVLVTCPSRGVARRMSTTLVTRHLAACVNIIPGVDSTFWWKGKIDRAREVLLLIKTTAARLPALKRAVVALHPYEIPEILAIPVASGHPPYLRWIASSLASP